MSIYATRGALGSRQRLSFVLSLTLFLPWVDAFAQTPTLSGNNSFTGINTFPSVNNIIYVDGVKHATLAGALTACPSTGCIVYTTIPEAWTTDVLNTAPSGTHIYFGAGKWTTTVTQILPSNVIVTGESGRNAGQQGTAIQAAAGFPTTGAAVVQLGSTGSSFEGVRVENMTVDCNNLAKSTGILNDGAQEKSGARDVLITACPAIGLDVETSGQGSIWDNIEVFPASWNNNCSNCTSSTLLLKVNSTANVSFHNLTLNADGASISPSIGAQVTLSQVHFDGSIHCEGVATTCFNLNSSIMDMHHVNCSHGTVSTLPNCIVIQSSMSNIGLFGVSVDSNTTNIIDDLQNHNVLTGSGEGSSVALYVTGNGATQPVITSSVNFASRLAALTIEGNLNVGGTITKGGGSFKIDHPLDPARKYLSHSFVESPDMMNIYNGTVLLDASGEAQVSLPLYFEALNRDFRYQLTPVGGYAQVYVAQEVRGNMFRIAGGKAGLKVSWQVTGIRKDTYANSHRIQVEEDKSSSDDRLDRPTKHN